MPEFRRDPVVGVGSLSRPIEFSDPPISGRTIRRCPSFHSAVLPRERGSDASGDLAYRDAGASANSPGWNIRLFRTSSGPSD